LYGKSHNTRRSIIRIEYFVSVGETVNHRLTRRLTAALVVALLATGASECKHDTDTGNSSGTQQAQGSEHDGSIDPELVRCANFRAAFDDMKPTDEERKLTGAAQLKSSYKASQKFYAAFAKIFPESATAANALSDIYARAQKGPLPPAVEAKIGGYDNKINKVIDKHCPNSGYPAG